MQHLEKITWGLLLAITVLGLSACGTSKMAKYMDAHRLVFEEAIANNLSPEQKLDVVANSLVSALEESLSYSSTKKSVQHIERFSKQNEKYLNILLKDLDGWVANMSSTDKIMMLGKIATKTYTGKMIQLVPKVERKINRKIQTFKIASKIIGFIKPNFL